ncbi:MAG: VWA domain-containing protein [candidate division Zixibacteria bacterium]|nr:VWA domain-containing protein [candidate division Zixibacteria bacterium]
MKRITLIMISIMAFTTAVLADGVMIIPNPKPWMPPKPAINVKYHHVDVEINDPAALTEIDQVFVNPYRREIEADYIFPIPEGAVISRFVAWLDGRKMEAELLDADQARKIYEDIVRQRKDPALLEYAGRGMYRLRVYPIPARGEVRIKIEYEESLKSDNGTVEYIYPLNTEKYSGENLQDCTVDAAIKSFDKIGALYCPSHQIETKRTGDRSFAVHYSERNVKPDKDFALYFTRQNRDFGFHLLSYRERNNKDGYFLGILAPPFKKNNNDIDKNIIFVLDSSGSMRGDKFKQAIAALKFVLLGLNDGDDFNIIDYDDSIKPFKQSLVRADRTNIEEAIDFAERLDASGGTNIYDALAAACSMTSYDNDPTYILFLTDGLPTSGIIDIENIINNTKTLNEHRARLFTFGVGFDVNAHLLDRLAQGNSGVSEYVLPDEDIEVKVSRFASRISSPALTDVSLSFSSIRDYNIYPNQLPDLFHGSEIIIVGRYDGNGSSQAIIKGKIGNRDITYEFPVNFNDGSEKDEFIPLLWANRRISHLIQQMRLHGTQDELLNEVIALSKKFGIVTEYTSFLVTGDGQRQAEEFRAMPLPEANEYIGRKFKDLSSYQTGRAAVAQSKSLNKKYSSTQNAPANEIIIDGEEKHFSNITQVGSQGFFQAGDNWIQGDIEGDKFDMEVKRYSKAYFQLLENDQSLGRYLGLGEQVRLKIGAQVVQISDSGKENLTEKELKLLFPNL